MYRGKYNPKIRERPPGRRYMKKKVRKLTTTKATIALLQKVILSESRRELNREMGILGDEQVGVGEGKPVSASYEARIAASAARNNGRKAWFKKMCTHFVSSGGSQK